MDRILLSVRRCKAELLKLAPHSLRPRPLIPASCSRPGGAASNYGGHVSTWLNFSHRPYGFVPGSLHCTTWQTYGQRKRDCSSKNFMGPTLDQDRLQCPPDPVAGRQTACCPLDKYEVPLPTLDPSGLARIIPTLYSMAPPMSIVTCQLSTYLCYERHSSGTCMFTIESHLRGPFWSWPRAVLVVTVGRIRHSENLWAVLVGAVLVHGPFWYRPQ